MSLALTIITPDGVVQAADSRVTLSVERQNGFVTTHHFDNATKLLVFKEPHNYISVTTYDAGTIGNRTASSFLTEFQATLPPNRISVKAFAKRLLNFYKDRWNEVYSTDDRHMRFQVAGINKNKIYGELYLVNVPDDNEPILGIDSGNFSLFWGGDTSIVQRLILGHDPQLPVLLEQCGFSEPDQQKIWDKIEVVKQSHNLPIDAYSLQDALELVRFLISATSRLQELSINQKTVGGAIDVCCITKDDGYRFTNQKELK